jgi:hypothetical protein
VFAVPVVLAGFAANVVAWLKDARWFQVFGQFAAAAAIGLLGVTLLAFARPVVEIHVALLAVALLAGAAVVLVAALRGVHPLVLIGGAALVGTAFGLVGWE